MFTKTKLVVTKEELETLTPDGFGKDLKGLYEEFLKATDDFEFFALLYVGSTEETNGDIIEKFKKVHFMFSKTPDKYAIERFYHDFWYGDVSINTSKVGYDRYLCETHDEIVHQEMIDEIIKYYSDSPYYLYENMLKEGYKYINYDDDRDLIDACGV